MNRPKLARNLTHAKNVTRSLGNEYFFINNLTLVRKINPARTVTRNFGNLIKNKLTLVRKLIIAKSVRRTIKDVIRIIKLVRLGIGIVVLVLSIGY